MSIRNYNTSVASPDKSSYFICWKKDRVNVVCNSNISDATVKNRFHFVHVFIHWKTWL